MADDLNVDTVPTLLLDRYRVEGLLGEGGLGTVIKAFDTRLKRMVAIKTLKRSSYTADPVLFRALEERFAREAEAGSRMGSNANLVTVYDLVTDADRTQYLILEYVAGGTLADRIKAGPLPRADALRLTADAARGLQAAHNVGIIHRDVKPANIFLGEDGRAQVGDFGIAQIDDISGRTQTTTGHPGTPLYMSPEQAHSTGYVRASSDQYSLGLVLFEMLTGTAHKRLEKHEADALLAAQPPPIRTLIARMIAPEPGDRYPGMPAILTAIQSIASTPTQASYDEVSTLTAPLPDAITSRETPAINLQPVPPAVAQPPPPPARTGARSGSRIFGFAAGGLVVVALAAIVLFFLVRPNASGTATATPLVAASAGISTSTQSISATSTITRTISPAASATTGTGTPSPAVASLPGVSLTQPASVVAGGSPPVTSLLAYLDGRVTLPGEGQTDGKIIGSPVQVVGLDLSRNEPIRLPSVTTPDGSRAVRTLWAPQGTYLATLVRQPDSGGFSNSLDLIVIDITNGKATTVAKAINTLPAWSPDGTTLVYGLLAGKRVPPPEAGYTTPIDSYDVHLVSPDGKNDRIIANVLPYQGGCGAGAVLDPIQEFVRADQFFRARNSTAWAADNSRIAIYVGVTAFTLRPDGSDLKVATVICPNNITVDLGTIIGATTDDAYIPTNGMQIRMADDDDALQWRYEHGLVPTTIILGCDKVPTTDVCNNSKKGTANSGYRNQIVVRFPDGTERKLTNSATFKYHATPSPDGTVVAFTGITVSNYASAAADVYKFFTGYSVDVYFVRISGGPDIKASTSGSGHHPSWQRDVPVKPVARATATPRPPEPTSPPIAPPTPRPASAGQTTWTDPDGRIRLQYPSGWKATRDTSTGNVLELDGPEGVFLYVNIFNRDRPAAEGLQAFHNRHVASTTRNYKDGAIQPTRVGGASGAFMQYSSTNKSGAADPHTGEVWYIDSGDKQFVIEVFTTSTSLHRVDEINGIINSIVFLR